MVIKSPHNLTVSSYAIRDAEEYKNFCDRSKDQRPQPEEVIGDIAEHLTTIHLKQCERGKRCLYEVLLTNLRSSQARPLCFSNSFRMVQHTALLKNNEIHTWDRGYDDDDHQVWGVKGGPYEFKPAAVALSFTDMFSPLNSLPPVSIEKRIEGSFVLQEE
ncbi:hypothetical protein GIB67_038296 [Kingdonia uniflora]|uniref:Uncharacterized protein n=1 Tax=Kingdonia uniflora TaxID=39325 RepID=A0A7J7KUG9_9MAGN|nr:hypothetical protein GIB67_038296 [Kingdonia uniflora]